MEIFFPSSSAVATNKFVFTAIHVFSGQAFNTFRRFAFEYGQNALIRLLDMKLICRWIFFFFLINVFSSTCAGSSQCHIFFSLVVRSAACDDCCNEKFNLSTNGFVGGNNENHFRLSLCATYQMAAFRWQAIWCQFFFPTHRMCYAYILLFCVRCFAFLLWAEYLIRWRIS